MNWVKPFADKFITGHYGTMSAYRRKMKMQAHSGTDWARPEGTEIRAIANGRVTLIAYSKILGHVLVQKARHKNGQLYYIGYCHLKEKPTLKDNSGLIAGQTVIGLVGNTGSASTGAHLHATISKEPRGVFGITAVKEDLYKLIEENSSSRTESIKAKPTEAKAKLCPTCGQETK
jgi:murein DD-endopeptidase MepM/ murein hydrolase activator NlpD